MNFYPFIDNSDNHHPQYYNLLDFPPSHFSYITYDSTSIDKSLNLPPPIRPYAKQHPLPPSIDTTSNIFLQTFSSSSNVILNTNPTTNPFFLPLHLKLPQQLQTFLLLIHQTSIVLLLTLHL